MRGGLKLFLLLSLESNAQLKGLSSHDGSWRALSCPSRDIAEGIYFIAIGDAEKSRTTELDSKYLRSIQRPYLVTYY